MKIRKRNLFRLAIDLGDKVNIWFQDVFGFNAKRKVLEKKQDFVTMKELDNTIGRSLGIISGPKPISELVAMKAKETDMGTYEELTISPKMITEFVSFAQKTKLIDEPKNIKANYWDEKKYRSEYEAKKALIDPKHSRKLSEIDFNELRVPDLRISFMIDVTKYYKVDGVIDNDESDSSGPAYKEFKADFRNYFSEVIDEEHIQLYINLLNEPDLTEPFYNDYESFLENSLEGYSQPYAEKYYLRDGDRKVDGGTGWSYFQSIDEDYYPKEDLVSFEVDEAVTNVISYIEEISIDIQSIEIEINGQKLNFVFNDEKDLKHLVVMLMAIYRKDLAEQINQALLVNL